MTKLVNQRRQPQFIFLIGVFMLYSLLPPKPVRAAEPNGRQATLSGVIRIDEKNPAPSANLPSDDPEVVVKNSVIVLAIVACTTLGVVAAFILIFRLLRNQPPVNCESYFGNGLLMQMLVVVIISECVFALAVAGVLKATEVGTIYGGIVGYVLGNRVRGPEKESGTGGNR